MRPLSLRVINNLKRPRAVLSWLAYQLYRDRKMDRMIITLPSSGTYWMRQMVSRMLIRNYGWDDDISSIKTDDLIPTFRNKFHRFKYTDDPNVVRIQHSHAFYSPVYFKNRQCLIQVRDLRNALVSHYRTYRDTKHSGIGFSDFLRGVGVDRPGQIRGNTLLTLIAFLNSWNKGMHDLDACRLVRYEDLKGHTTDTMRAIADFMGFDNLSDNDVEEIVFESNIENMSKMEDRNPLLQYQGKVKKVRLNDQSKYDQYFGEDDKEYFVDTVQKSLDNHFGYDYTGW